MSGHPKRTKLEVQIVEESLKVRKINIIEAHSNNLTQNGAPENTGLVTVKTLALSPCNTYMYIGGYDCNEITVLKSENLSFYEYLEGHTDCVFSIKVDQAKQRMVSGGRDSQIIIWGYQYTEGRIVHSILNQIKFKGHFISVGLIEDMAFAVNNSNHLVLVDLQNSNTVHVLNKLTQSDYNDFKCASVGPYVFAYHSKLTHSILSFNCLPRRFKSFNVINTRSKGFTLLAIPLSRVLISGGYSGSLAIFDVLTRKQIFFTDVLNNNANEIISIDYSHRKHLVLLASKNCIHLVSLKNKIPFLINRLKTSQFQCQALTPDCKTLVTAGNHTVRSASVTQDLFGEESGNLD